MYSKKPGEMLKYSVAEPNLEAADVNETCRLKHRLFFSFCPFFPVSHGTSKNLLTPIAGHIIGNGGRPAHCQVKKGTAATEARNSNSGYTNNTPCPLVREAAPVDMVGGGWQQRVAF
ncbi:hypothetical protein J3458_013466 [Metarhizium acridum]|uniref:uncharacterized protein n=1 Tax=Metarhizium acridum TaxID=92637 RepID=UPI001C6CDC98|nr:hypothetical protein J3458_013466 [Metarhizium acridum]